MPRPLAEQVVVLTGASSGIGREAAAQFARRGASVVLAARNTTALSEVEHLVGREGGTAEVVQTDVADRAAVEHLAHRAVERFGRIDTWINNASVTLYAPVEASEVDELERVVQVNLLGTIYGTKAALAQMRRQGAGTIINNASILGERAVPLQAAYCAAKHGVKGFTEALRLEQEREDTGVVVTLILPSSINTPLFEHARSKLGRKPQPVPPVYPPSAVAEAMVFAAEHPRRDIVVGGAGRLLVLSQRLSPRLVDRLMLLGGQMWRLQESDQPDHPEDNLFGPWSDAGGTTGSFGSVSVSRSLYTRIFALHPARGRVATAVAALAALHRRRR